MGALGNMTGAIKSKLTGTTPSGDDDLAGKTTVTVDVVEDTRPGQVATKLKAADQMTGQTFNDVGEMDEEDRKVNVTVGDKGKL